MQFVLFRLLEIQALVIMISERCQCFCHFHKYCCHRSNAVHVRDVLPPYGLEVRFIYNFWSYCYFLRCTYMILFSVIVYDRFGLHREYLESILTSHGFYYHPFTVYQLAQPSKYNSEYAKRQGFGNKYYYKMEKSWVKGYGDNKADTADQDQDKTRTYDYSRLEFSHMDTILYLGVKCHSCVFVW